MAKTVCDLLRFDPLSAAEEITGIAYNDSAHGEGFDNSAAALGFLLAQQHAAEKDKALRELGDTLFHNELPRYLSIIDRLGFKEILAEKWDSSHGHVETFFIFAHPDGLLLKFDTFGGNRVNGGNVYYQWRPAVDDWWRCTSSGRMIADGIWAGDHAGKLSSTI